MLPSLRERLAFFACAPDRVKVARTLEDIQRYELPPDFTKQSDSRRAAFVAQHGDVAVELDALPVEVLRQRLEEEVTARMDLPALRKVRRREARDRTQLRARLAKAR